MTFPIEEPPARELRRNRKPDILIKATGRRKLPAPVENTITFQITAPRQTHFRRITCAERGCREYLYGWQTIVDLSTELGQRQAAYIKDVSLRAYTTQMVSSDLLAFNFSPGQEAFGEHWERREEVPERFISYGGDWRGSASGDPPRVYPSPDEWSGTFRQHMRTLVEQIYEIGEVNGSRGNAGGVRSSLGWTALEIDDPHGAARAIKNDVTNLEFALPRAILDETGTTERLLLLTDFSITIDGIFNDTAGRSHDVFKDGSSLGTPRTVTLSAGGQSMTGEWLFADYVLVRDGGGVFVWSSSGVLGGGTVPAWS